MHVHLFIVTFYVITVKCQQFPTIPNSNTRSSETARLKKDLFCNYDPAGKPSKNITSYTNVSVALWPKHIDYFQIWPFNTDEIKINAWMSWSWRDEFLQWDPQKYSGIDYLVLGSENIWTPYIFHFSASDETAIISNLFGTKCRVDSVGIVSCFVPSVFQALCIADLTTWPMDKHTCELVFSLLQQYIEVTVTDVDYFLLEYEPNQEWELLSIKTSEENANVIYFIEIRRHAAAYVAAILTPAIVLSVFTLLIFWINPECNNRIYLCCMNIFTYFLYMQYLNYSLPDSGDTCPKIVFFYRDSLLLAAVALAISVFLRNASALVTIPPYWFIYFSNLLRDTTVGQIVMFPHLTSKETTINEESGEEVLLPVLTSKWKLIVCLVDRLLFYLYSVIFLCLFLVSII